MMVRLPAASSDPDRGLWSYTWDGLGRLRTQMDARAATGLRMQVSDPGILLAFQYDADGRLERRFVVRPGEVQGLLEANWQYDLNNKQGTLGAMLGAVDVTRAALYSDPACPGSTTCYFDREYSYDSL